MSLYPVINQVSGVIGEGDVDDCAPTATIWAARAADPCARRPTIPEFRRAAGNPDDPNRPDGLTNGQLAQAVPIIWPLADSMRLDTKSWTAFMSYLNDGQVLSVAVNSAHLPSNLRFGFYGNHRVGIEKHLGTIYCANPLAPNGSRPIAISEAGLKYAMSTLVGAVGWYLAICFKRQPVHLRFKGKRTSPFPDRQRANRYRVYVYSTPVSPGRTTRVGSLLKGQLFVAYQQTVGLNGSVFYGNHRGTKWVRAGSMTAKGGSS